MVNLLTVAKEKNWNDVFSILHISFINNYRTAVLGTLKWKVTDKSLEKPRLIAEILETPFQRKKEK